MTNLPQAAQSEAVFLVSLRAVSLAFSPQDAKLLSELHLKHSKAMTVKKNPRFVVHKKADIF